MMILTTGRSADVALSGRMRVAAVVFTLLVLILTLFRWQPLHALFWIAFGATATLPIYMIFSAGIWSVVPLVCLVEYAAMIGRDMATPI
ncbi:MAG: hypothetical protein ACR2OE_16225 [Thermomicrobiales bacterium]